MEIKLEKWGDIFQKYPTTIQKNLMQIKFEIKIKIKTVTKQFIRKSQKRKISTF